MMLRALLILLFLSLPVQVFAQDENVEETQEQGSAEDTVEIPKGLYSPEHCEFGITFPEAPYATRKCEGENKTKCYDLVSYTHVYEMASTINFRVICSKISQTVADAYKEELMVSTLKAMARDAGADEFNSDSRETENYKQGGLAGMGTVGRNPMIYVAQLWVGEQSILSVEGELIGEAFEAADKLYADILKTVEYTGKKEVIPPPKTDAPDKE